MGRIGKRNSDANRKLKKLFQDKGITRCEIGMVGCWYSNALGFAHRKTRRHYYATPEKLYDFNEVIMACVICHQYIEGNKEATEYYFKKLRPDASHSV